MEIKINKEIRDYKESIFFGLSFRQFFFSVIAVIVAVILYFILRNFMGLETVSWLCILGAIPFAAFGFFRYNGMYLEEFIVAWVRSEILTPKVLLFKPENIYVEMLKEHNKKLKKEAMKDDVLVQQKKEKRQRKRKNTKISTTSNSDKENI